MKRTLKKAFTITELVIVIAVIAILAAVLIPTFSNVIESANKSAALQTCNTALRDYNAKAAQDGKEIDGIVFSSNDYAYVYWNKGLHYIGKLGTDDFATVNQSGVLSKGKVDKALTDLFDANKEVDTSAIKNVKFSVQDKSGVDSEQSLVDVNVDKDIKSGDVVKEKALASAVANDCNGEILYFYSANINNTDYIGCFTMESGSNPLRTDEGATYSRLAGCAATSVYTVSITLSTTAREAN